MAKGKGSVHIETDHCKGCGLCVVSCPLTLLVLDDNTANAKGYPPVMIESLADCIGCGNCALMCPDSVITVKRLPYKRRATHV
jgi:2-oxoglutarate ferredoxin oxidoreductase subunit delta